MSLGTRTHTHWCVDRYCAATTLGQVPWLILDIYFGSMLKDIEEVNNAHSTTYMVMMLVITVISTAVVTAIAKQMLRKLEREARLHKDLSEANDGELPELPDTAEAGESRHQLDDAGTAATTLRTPTRPV